jgi:hypothetical protein
VPTSEAQKRAYKKWATKNKAFLAEHQRNKLKKNPEKIRAIGRKSQAKRQAAMTAEELRRYKRNSYLKTTFGITLDQYEELLSRQGGVCAVCGSPDTMTRRGKHTSLDVDHDHATGQVRAILCSGCNSSLGLLKEDPERIRALAEYIEQWQ